ncbi:MAG: MFS transporter [Armatimonadetes bacterium]|nr:MFS transporter [Armatimonadota bacterium]
MSSVTSTSTPSVPAPSRISIGSRPLVTAAVMLGIFLAALDATVVSTAMPTIVRSLGGLSLYSWVFAAYQLAATAAMPAFGRLSDLYGRKRLYLIGIGTFLGGSVLCGLATSIEQLVAFRILQGLGAGAVLTVAFTIVGDIYTLEERARIQGLFSGMWGLASIVGPLMGGIFVDYLGWPWVFFINLPVGVLATAVVVWSFREPPMTARQGSVDYPGIATLTLGTVALLIAFHDRAGAPAALPLLVGVAALAGFVVIERRSPHPMIPVSLLGNRIFSVGSYMGFLVGAAMFGSTYFVPLFVQGVMGTSATKAGAVLTPFSLGWMFSSIVASRMLLRFGPRRITTVGLATMTAGFVLIVLFSTQMTYAFVLWTAVLLGMGMGSTTSVFMVSVQSTVTRAERGVATSGMMYARNVGSAVGVAVMGILFVARLQALLGSVAVGTVTGARVSQLLLDPRSRAALTTETLEPLRHALAVSLRSVFVLGLVLVVAASVGILFLPRGRLRDSRDA